MKATQRDEVEAIIYLVSRCRQLGAVRLVYDGLEVTFEPGAPRQGTASSSEPNATEVEPVAHQDQKIDIFGPEGENLMLTDPLVYEEMVERVLREKRV